MRIRYVLIGLVLAACVRQSKYDTLQAQNKKLQADLTAAQQKQAETEKTLGDKIKDLQAQLDSLDTASKSKEAELGTVKGRMAATEAELAELRRQKEAAEKRIAAYKALQDKFRAL